MHVIKYSTHLLSDRQVNSQKVNINMNFIPSNKGKAMSRFENSFYHCQPSVVCNGR